MPTLPFSLLPSARSHLPGRKVTMLCDAGTRGQTGSRLPSSMSFTSPAPTQARTRYLCQCQIVAYHPLEVAKAQQLWACLEKCPDACTHLANIYSNPYKGSTSFPIRMMSVNKDSEITSWTMWNCHFSQSNIVNYQQFHMLQTNLAQTIIWTGIGTNLTRIWYLEVCHLRHRTR